MIQHGMKPLTRIVAWNRVGCDPSVMGIGPVEAIRGALVASGMTLDQMDIIEINEAFAAQYLACEKELGMTTIHYTLYNYTLHTIDIH